MRINEGDKVRLNTGEIAMIADVLQEGVAYVAEIYRTLDGYEIEMEHVWHKDIASVFVVTETPLQQVG